MDVRGDFVLLELDRSGEEELIRRLKEHHAWVASQVPFLRRLYGSGPLSPFRPPRVIALSEEFSEQFAEHTRALDLPLTLLRYRILLSADRPLLYLEPLGQDEEVPSPPPSGSMESPSIEPERLTPEEWEEFYGFEQRRLAREGREERVER